MAHRRAFNADFARECVLYHQPETMGSDASEHDPVTRLLAACLSLVYSGRTSQEYNEFARPACEAYHPATCHDFRLESART